GPRPCRGAGGRATHGAPLLRRRGTRDRGTGPPGAGGGTPPRSGTRPGARRRVAGERRRGPRPRPLPRYRRATLPPPPTGAGRGDGGVRGGARRTGGGVDPDPPRAPGTERGGGAHDPHARPPCRPDPRRLPGG